MFISLYQIQLFDINWHLVRCNVWCCSHIRVLYQPRRKSLQLHIWGLSHIRRSMSRDVASIMAACLVGTRLDYWNTLLRGATKKSLNKLQRVRNKLAWVVCNVTTRQQHTTPSISFVIFIGFPSEAALHSGCHLVLQSIPAQSTKLSACHIVAIRATPSTEICWDGLADSTKVAYQDSSTSLLFCGANSLKRTSNSHVWLRRDFLAEQQEVLLRAPGSILNMFIYWN